jgi:hypothetical protein
MYANSGQREMGGIDGIAAIADRQIGPTCGLEAVENIVQLFVPARNDLSRTTLEPMASRAGYLVWGVYGPELVSYALQPLLASFGISTQWASLDHQHLVDALAQNRVAIAVVDAHYLDSNVYPFRKSWHAILITNYVTDPTGRTVVMYAGIDSNYGGQVLCWPLETLDIAARAAGQAPLLITDEATHFGRHNVHYFRHVDGTVYRHR